MEEKPHTTSETEYDIAAVTQLKPPPTVINYWPFQSGSSVVNWCQCFGDVSLYVCPYYCSSVCVAEKNILTICNVGYFLF